MKTKTKSNEEEAPSPVRRPGVYHNYHDYSNLSVSEINMLFPGAAVAGLRQHNPLASGAQQQGFAVKLYYMLADVEANGEADIVSWRPHGRCFMVHDRKAFVERILPSYFLQSNFASFQRQLNLYGFKRLASAKDKGGYYHELFLRGKPELACYIQRMKKKGNGPRKPDSPESEPDFYSMPFMPPPQSAGGQAPAAYAQGQPSACQQGQMMMMQPFRYDPQYKAQPADAQMLSLRKLLPATMQPGAGSMGHQSYPPLSPYVAFPHQGSYSSGQGQRAGHGDLEVNEDFLQPIAHRPSDTYYNQWTQLPPPAYPSSSGNVEPIRSAPEYMQRSTQPYEYQETYAMPNQANGYPVPPGSKQRENDGPGTAPPADFFGGRPMPPKPSVPTPGVLERGVGSAVVSGTEAFAPLESNQQSTQTHSRRNSGTLSPAAWNNAFGEGEDIWNWLK